MPNVSSPLNTANSAVPLIHQSALSQLPGIHVVFADIAKLNDAIASEKANIAAGNPLWSTGQILSIMAGSQQGIYRTWDSAAQHARNVIIRNGLTLTLASDLNTVIATVGLPLNSTGINGDYSVDWSDNSYSLKTAGAWSKIGNIYFPSTNQTVAINANIVITAANAVNYNGKTLIFSAAYTVTIQSGITAQFPSFSFNFAPPSTGKASILSDGISVLNNNTLAVVAFGAASCTLRAQGSDNYRVEQGVIPSQVSRLNPVIVSGEWKEISSIIMRIRFTGTGTAVIDSRNRLNVVSSNVANYTLTAETNRIEWPYPGDDAYEFRITLTGTAAAEVLQ